MPECPVAPELSVRLLGGVSLRLGDRKLRPFPTQKSQALFGFLVLRPDRMIHRDLVCGQFWPELPDATARKALRTSLWRVRSVLEPDPTLRGRFLRVDGGMIGFQGGPGVWVDAWEFDALLDGVGRPGGAGPPSAELDRLEEAVTLYRGELLEGHYDAWCEEQQARYRLRYLLTLERLGTHYEERREWERAILAGERLLQHDPLKESAYRLLMKCHFALGDRASALRRYEECVHQLESELEVEPMEETMKLHGRIRGIQEPPVRPAEAQGEPTEDLAAEVERALRTLYGVTRRLEKARVALGDAASTVRGGA